MIRRGEIYWTNLDPALGAELRKRRPALVASNDVNNEHSPTVTVLPLTTAGMEKAYPFQVKVPAGICAGLERCKVKAEQVRTVDKRRLVGQALGVLPAGLMVEVDAALRLHLGLG